LFFDAFIGSSYIVPFRVFCCFSNDCLVPFLELIFRHVSKGDSNTSFSNQILHLANPHDKLNTFVLYPSLGHISLSFHMQDEGFGMEQMSFDDLGLLLRVIEIRVVLHMLVHGIRFPIL
jgi:hypothetical protein